MTYLLQCFVGVNVSSSWCFHAMRWTLRRNGLGGWEEGLRLFLVDGLASDVRQCLRLLLFVVSEEVFGLILVLVIDGLLGVTGLL